mgnify:CR=1 FL=1
MIASMGYYLYKENDFIREVTINNSKETNIYLISKEDINVVIKKNATTDKLKINISKETNVAKKIVLLEKMASLKKKESVKDERN